jgi:hypothetical protein
MVHRSAPDAVLLDSMAVIAMKRSSAGLRPLV